MGDLIAYAVYVIAGVLILGFVILKGIAQLFKRF